MTPKNPVPLDAGASDISPVDSNTALRRLLIVIHPRELLRGFLCYWLCTLDLDFEVVSAAEVTQLIPSDTLSRTCAVVIGEIGSAWADTWLHDQIAFLRAARPTVPIVVICEEDSAEKYVGMDLEGYIPTSSTVEVAAAAINLVTVGGSYTPYAWNKHPDSKSLLPPCPAIELGAAASLTPREEVVLDLLQRGMPNKIIAHNLRISHSTVKAHVHNIIAKLAVHNRTEAAVTARRMQSPNPNMDGVTQPPSNCEQQVSDAASGVDLAHRVNGLGQVRPRATRSAKRGSR